MTKKTIKYVGFYDVLDSESDRVSNLAAINKMNYISDVLVEVGYDVEFVSPSWMGKDTLVKYEKQNTIKLDQNKSITFCPSWKTKHKVTDYIKIIFSLLWLFIYLIINVNREESIVAYHVQWISLPVRAAKFVKKFNLILEIEEVYGDVWDNSKLLNKWEEKLIESADEYLYVSDLLREKLQDSNKNGAVVYGSYHVKKERLHNNKPIDSNIKLVYAGSIDDTKGGAYNAVETMKYLPVNYSLSILGHGDENSINLLIEMINSLNNLKGKTVCTYEGTKYGDEYSNFLSNCDVALNPQHQGHYMMTAFPSKIISYLAHNLRVVTTDIKSVRMSEVANLLYFANDDKPKNIAKAIINIDFKQEYNSSNLILNMHDNLVLKFKNMLEKNEKSS